MNSLEVKKSLLNNTENAAQEGRCMEMIHRKPTHSGNLKVVMTKTKANKANHLAYTRMSSMSDQFLIETSVQHYFNVTSQYDL